MLNQFFLLFVALSGVLVNASSFDEASGRCILTWTKYLQEMKVIGVAFKGAVAHASGLGVEDGHRVFGLAVKDGRRNTFYRRRAVSSLEGDVSSPVMTFEAGDLGSLELVNHVASKELVSVYFARQSGGVGTPLVVKYINDCDQLPYVAPNTVENWEMSVSREFALTRALSGKEVVPEMRWLSGLIPMTPASQFGFDLSNKLKDACSAAGAQVRTIVQETMGDSAESFVNAAIKNLTPFGALEQKAYLRMILKIGRATFGLLEKLHEEGIIHGDLHWGNVAFRSVPGPGSQEFDLRLIDLGLSAVMCGDDEAALASPAGLNKSLVAPWALHNGPRGYRDDIFRNPFVGGCS